MWITVRDDDDVSRTFPTRPNYSELGALVARTRGTDEWRPFPPLFKPAHNTNAAASNHVSRSTWKAAGCHAPQTPRRLICVMSASSVGKKGANYVDGVSNWMRWQKEREESGSSEVIRGTSDWSIASNSSLSLAKQAGLGQTDRLFVSEKMPRLKPSIRWRGHSPKNTPTEWLILKVKWSAIVPFSCFFYFSSKKKTNKDICTLWALRFPRTLHGKKGNDDGRALWPHSFLSFVTTACSAQPLRMQLRLLPLRRGIKRERGKT